MRLLLAIIVVAMAVAVLQWRHGHAREEAPTSFSTPTQHQPPTAPRISFQDKPQWLGKLRTKAEITFLAEADQRTTTDSLVRQQVGRLTSLGALAGTDLESAKAFAAALYEQRQRKLLELQQRMQPSSLKDAFDEARRMYDVEAALAVQECLRTGGYVVLPQGQRLPDGMTDDVLTMGVVKDGQTASAVFVFLREEHPQLASLKSYVRATEDMFLEDLVSRFNSKDFEARRAMLRRRDDLIQRDKQTWSAEDRAFILEWFPTWVGVEHEFATLSKLPR